MKKINLLFVVTMTAIVFLSSFTTFKGTAKTKSILLINRRLNYHAVGVFRYYEPGLPGIYLDLTVYVSDANNSHIVYLQSTADANVETATGTYTSSGNSVSDVNCSHYSITNANGTLQ